jgi:hypothetical protein
MENEIEVIEALQHNASFIDKLSNVIKTNEMMLKRQREMMLLMQEKNDLVKEENAKLQEENKRLKGILFPIN